MGGVRHVPHPTFKDGCIKQFAIATSTNHELLSRCVDCRDALDARSKVVSFGRLVVNALHRALLRRLRTEQCHRRSIDNASCRDNPDILFSVVR